MSKPAKSDNIIRHLDTMKHCANAPTNRRAWDCEAIMSQKIVEIHDQYVAKLKQFRRADSMAKSLAALGYTTDEIRVAITNDRRQFRRDTAVAIADEKSMSSISTETIVEILLKLY